MGQTNYELKNIYTHSRDEYFFFDFTHLHCVQTDPAKNAWTRAYLIPVYQAGWSGRQMFRTAKIAYAICSGSELLA
jgi:hypothetical protein